MYQVVVVMVEDIVADGCSEREILLSKLRLNARPYIPQPGSKRAM